MQISNLCSKIAPMLFSLLLLSQSNAAAPTEPPTPHDLYSKIPTPHALDTAKNSGAVCVHFIEQLYEGQHGFWEIAELCQVSRAGTNLGKIQHSLRGLGFHTAGFKGTTASLKRIRHPAIVRAQVMNEDDSTQRGTKDYFMVVKKWDANKGVFHVFEPPREQSEMSFSELDQRFAGTALLVSKEQLPTVESGFHSKPPRIAAFAFGAASTFLIAFLLPKRMNRNVALMIGLAVVTFVGCSRKSSESDPHVFDAGQVAPGTKVSHTFRVYNRSPHQVEFQEIVGDCKCATALIGELPVAVGPGAFAEASVEINTKDLRGPTDRKIMVVTSAEDPRYKMIELTFRVDAASLAKHSPELIHFGDIGPGEAPDETVQIRLARTDFANALKSVDCRGGWFSAEVIQKKGEWLNLKVSVLPKAKPTGTLFGELVVEFDHPEIVEPLTIPLVASVTGDLNTIPDRVTKSIRTRGERKTQKLRVQSVSHRPFRITDVVCPEGFEVNDESFDEETDSHNVTLKWSSHEQDWSQLEPVILKTDLPSELYVYLRE